VSTPPAASLDIGTNSILLLVGRRSEGGELEVLDDRCATARLGRGLAKDGCLDDRAIERALAILAEHLERTRELGVPADRVRAAGTAVLRRATDAQRFLAACEQQLGLAVEVLSEADEARLGHSAVAELAGPDCVAIDVGGGSTEVVTDAGSQLESAPVGAVVLTERYLGLEGGPAALPGGWGALTAEIAGAFSVFEAGAARGREVVLLGGTASNLASLHLELACFDPRRAEGCRVPVRPAAEWADRLARSSTDERLAFPIEADRVEILPAGLACIAACLTRLGAEEGRVTGRGLRHALLPA